MLIVAPVTALYAGLYALLLLVLAARVSRLRRSLKIGLGDGGHEPLTRAVRTHGNAVEWGLPLLLLMLIAELNHASHVFLHACGIAFLLARVGHAVGLSRHSGGSQGRVVGTAVTWLVLALLALWNIGAFARTLLAAALT
jgi:uncharacterized membrane protein YecN with MAPEG domain